MNSQRISWLSLASSYFKLSVLRVPGLCILDLGERFADNAQRWAYARATRRRFSLPRNHRTMSRTSTRTVSNKDFLKSNPETGYLFKHSTCPEETNTSSRDMLESSFKPAFDKMYSVDHRHATDYRARSHHFCIHCPSSSTLAVEDCHYDIRDHLVLTLSPL